MMFRSFAIVASLAVASQGFAHEGQGSFTVLSMAPGAWICNAMVTQGSSDTVALPGGVVTQRRMNSVAATISGPWASTLLTARDDGKFMNLNMSNQALIRNRLDGIVFTLKSARYDAQYVVDLCTTDPGTDPGQMRGPEIKDFKTWVSVTDLSSANTGGIASIGGYLDRSQVKYSSKASCGGSSIYDPSTDNFQFADAAGSPYTVGPLSIITDLMVNQAASWNGNMGQSGINSPYCVTRFVFTETAISSLRSNILEGGVFNIAVSQSK